MANICHCQHILQAYRLTTNQVCTCLHTHIRHLLWTIFCDHAAQLLQVHIAFEWVIALWNQSFLMQHFHHFTATTSHVRFGCGKVEVHDCHCAWFHKTLSQDILAGTTLVCRQYIVCSKHLFHGCFQTSKGLATSIRIVCQVHRSSLTIGHRIHA